MANSLTRNTYPTRKKLIVFAPLITIVNALKVDCLPPFLTVLRQILVVNAFMSYVTINNPTHIILTAFLGTL